MVCCDARCGANITPQWSAVKFTTQWSAVILAPQLSSVVFTPVVCCDVHSTMVCCDVMLLCAVSLHKCLVSSDVVPTALGPSPHVPVVGT